MKCLACDCILTESEDRRKFTQSGERVGLCNRCAIYVDCSMENGDDITPVDEPFDVIEEEGDEFEFDNWRADEPTES